MDKSSYYSSISRTTITDRNFMAICMIMAIEDISYDEAINYFLITDKDNLYSSDSVMYSISSSNLEIFSQEFLSYLETGALF